MQSNFSFKKFTHSMWYAKIIDLEVMKFFILPSTLCGKRRNNLIQYSGYLIFIQDIFNSLDNQISNKEHFIRIDRSA